MLDFGGKNVGCCRKKRTPDGPQGLPSLSIGAPILVATNTCLELRMIALCVGTSC